MTKRRVNTKTVFQEEPKPASANLEKDITVGKDILALLTTGMYVDPLTIYREYIQNSVDAIDEAVDFGVLDSARDGFVQINVDAAERRITIRDNGLGIPNRQFEERLTSLGASKKRGNGFRGFRGVGRLCGLGYCQALTFRSKGLEDDVIRELTWDCRKLKRILGTTDFAGDLSEAIREVASVSTIQASRDDRVFFEVELDKVVRLKNDVLLNEQEVENYLCQVAPLPFQ